MNGEMYKKSLPLAEELATNNIRVTPVSTTPVGVLASIPMDVDEYAGALDELSTEISKLVSSHVNYFRNVVKPVYVEFKERLTESFAKYLDVSPVNEFTLDIFNIPTPLTLPILKDEIKQYDKNKRVPITHNLRLPLLSNPEDVLKYILTSNEDLNESIRIWIKENKIDIVEYYNDLAIISPSLSIPISGYDGLNKALFGYLLMTNMMENIPDNISVTLNEYRSSIIDAKTYFGRLLALYMDRLDHDINTIKRLVIYIDPKNKYIQVLGPVYEEWMRDNGDVDVLLGLVVTNTISSVSLNTINDSRDELKNAWIKYYRVAQSALRMKRIKDGKLVIRRVFLDMLEEMSDLEKETVKEIPDYKETVLKKLEEKLEDLDQDDISDLDYVAREIITEVRYYYTSAYDFFEVMNDLLVSDPDMDPQDAALAATIDYVGRYIAKQYRVE